MLTLLGLQLSAGINTARLRRELLHAAMERERRQLAAEVHDGLAQYLALARRELALPEPDRARLTEAVDAAHRLVRARLQELSADAPADLRQAIEKRGPALARERAREPGAARPGPEAVTLAARVVSEALANADAHAQRDRRRDHLRRRRRTARADRRRQRRRLRPPAPRPGRRGRPSRPDRDAPARTRPRRRVHDHLDTRQGNRRHPMDSALESAFEGGACPHVAMLLSSTEEVAPTLASFYALGAKRNGWLFHRSLRGRADADRDALASRRPRRRRARGRRPDGLPRDRPRRSRSRTTCTRGSPSSRPRSRGGFDAAWWARFPIGPDAAIIERSVEYDRAWDEHFHDRPCVSLCLYIVGDLERDHRAAQIALTHDTVLSG